MQVQPASSAPIDGVAKPAANAVAPDQSDFMALVQQAQARAAKAEARSSGVTGARDSDKAAATAARDAAAEERRAARRDELTERRGSERAQTVRQASATKHADSSAKVERADETVVEDEDADDDAAVAAAPANAAAAEEGAHPAAATADEQPPAAIVETDEQTAAPAPDPTVLVAPEVSAPQTAAVPQGQSGAVTPVVDPAQPAVPAQTPAPAEPAPQAVEAAEQPASVVPLQEVAAEAAEQPVVQAAEIAAPKAADAAAAAQPSAAAASTAATATEASFGTLLSAGDSVEIVAAKTIAGDDNATSTRAGLTATATLAQDVANGTDAVVRATDAAGDHTGGNTEQHDGAMQQQLGEAFDEAAAEKAMVTSADIAGEPVDATGRSGAAVAAPLPAAEAATAETAKPASSSSSSTAPTTAAGVGPAEARGNVAATPAAARAAPHQPVQQQVAAQISRAVEEGKDSISIKLRPLTMGTVEVKLAFEDGRVSAVVTCDNRDTFDMLQRDSRGMEKALQDAGLQTDANSLSFNLKGGEGREAQAADGHGRFGRNGRNGRDSQEEPQQQPTPRRFAGNRGIDIQV